MLFRKSDYPIKKEGFLDPIDLYAQKISIKINKQRSR